MTFNTDAMVQIVDNEVTFYTDKANSQNCYVEYELFNGALCFEEIGSSRFESFLGFRYREITKELALPDFSEILQIKVQDAIYTKANPVTIQRRLVGDLVCGIDYFLADEYWQTVSIDSNGWYVGTSSQYKFLKSAADQSQTKPKAGGDLLKLLRPYINLTEDNFKLFVVFLVQCFSKSSSHYVAILSSDKGTGKSTPNKTNEGAYRPFSDWCKFTLSNANELKNLLANTYLACFDNTAPLSTVFSNIMCAAITGTMDAKRKLYTDNDIVIRPIHNVIVLNGINIIPYKSDLSERSLLFELKKIKSHKRMTDSDFWSRFKIDKPALLGSIFDALSRAMQILPTLTIPRLDRMADAHTEMVAIAIALGMDQTEFQDIMDANIKKRNEAYAENNALVEIIVNFMRGKPRVSGPSNKIYREIFDSIVGDTHHFPGSASALTRKLNEEHDALKAAGYRVISGKTSDANTLSIEKISQNMKTKIKANASRMK